MRLGDHLLDDGRVEDLTADRHPLPEMVEDRAVDLGAHRRRCATQEGDVGEERAVRRELAEAEEVDLDQAELFEVGIRVAPATPLIEPDAVGKDLAERRLGFLQVEALEAGLEEPLGADLGGRAVEAERSLLRQAELFAA